MNIDLEVFFMKKPLDIDNAMASQGFDLEDVTSPGEGRRIDFETREYLYFDEKKSSRGVEFIYEDGMGMEEKELLGGVIPNPDSIVALGILSRHHTANSYDFEKHFETARFLKSRYNAIIYDPDEREIWDD